MNNIGWRPNVNKRCHPEGRAVCALKDLSLQSVQTLAVEVLRLSLSDSLRMTCWGKIATSEEGAGARGGECGARIHEGEQKKAGGDAEALREPPEGKAHGKLQNGGDDGEGGLCADHEVARDAGHQRRHAADRAARADNSLEYTNNSRTHPGYV